MRVCSKCKEEKPDTAFYSYKYQCKTCHQSYQQDPIRRKKWSEKYYRKQKETRPELFLWKQARHRAKENPKLIFDLLVEDIKIPEKCPYMGTPFVALDNQYAPSLDRIDSSKGYTKDNVQVISRLANTMKNNATEQELITFAKGVLAKHSKEV